MNDWLRKRESAQGKYGWLKVWESAQGKYGWLKVGESARGKYNWLRNENINGAYWFEIRDSGCLVVLKLQASGDVRHANSRLERGIGIVCHAGLKLEKGIN